MFTVGGKVTKSEIKSTKNGKEYLAFTVVETKGYGDTKESIWYDCMSWSTSTDYLGCKVLVFGQLSQREFQEKTYNNIDVFHVEVVEGPRVTPDVQQHSIKKTVQPPAASVRPPVAASQPYKKTPIPF